jgi:pimeloyl-ACP methyl ester carboxylesterase
MVRHVVVLVLVALASACSMPAAGPVPATISPTERVIAIPNVSPNPNVADPRFDALSGAKAYFGQSGGSGYRIEVPDKWNGDLILYAHGYRGTVPTLTITNLPIREVAIQQGYAWAASSYRANGYNPEEGVQDTLILREVFKQIVGSPRRTYIFGSSMGGHIVVASLEQYPDLFAGGLSECGVVSGIGEFDYLMSGELLAGYFSGVDFTAPANRTAVTANAALQQQVLPALGGSPDALTTSGRRYKSATINLTGGHRPYAEEGFADRYLANLSAGIGPIVGQTFKEKAATNADDRYHVDPGLGVDDAALNAGVGRIAADPSARSFDAHYEFTRFKGTLKVPLLTLHDTGDFFVPIALEQQYRATVDAAGASAMLVQRAVRRFKHCDFTATERVRAWNDLVAWVTTGVRPEGEDLRGSLQDVGRRWTEPLLPDDPGHP